MATMEKCKTSVLQLAPR